MEPRVIDVLTTAVPTVVPTAEPTPMSAGARAAMGVETTVNGMVIVFATLVIISLVVMIIAKVMSAGSKKKAVVAPEAPKAPVAEANVVATQPKVKGEGHLVTDGVGSEEEVAVIMAAVAAHSGASLESLDFKSITAIDD